MAFAQGGKAGGEVSPSIPTIPAAQLVGHDGPILDVAFTSKFGTTHATRCTDNSMMITLFALGLKLSRPS